MNSHSLSLLAFGSFVLGACASAPGARPSDMSAAQHEQAASSAEAQALSHGTQYEPNNRTATWTCGGQDTCWTSESNPTAEHRTDREKYRKIAADHRAAAQALRDAEARACVGVSEDNRDVSPFYHREDILTVENASRRTATPYDGESPNPPTVTGAVVTFRAVPGMTVEWLQRAVDCHVARNAAVGYDMPEMGYCPLAVKGVAATVSSARGAFAVTIEASDRAAIQEVLRRAQALKSSG